MDFTSMTIPQILKLQYQLEKELNSRTNNLASILATVEKIENRAFRIQNFYALKIRSLKNKSDELKKLEEMGFSVFLYSSSGNIGIINYDIKEKPNQYYGCEIDVNLRDVVFRESMYLESSHLRKIKEILKLI